MSEMFDPFNVVGYISKKKKTRERYIVLRECLKMTSLLDALHPGGIIYLCFEIHSSILCVSIFFFLMLFSQNNFFHRRWYLYWIFSVYLSANVLTFVPVKNNTVFSFIIVYLLSSSEFSRNRNLAEFGRRSTDSEKTKSKLLKYTWYT